MRDYVIAKSRSRSDQAVSGVLQGGEILRWSGTPGFVATFNMIEFVTCTLFVSMIAFFAVVFFGHGDFGLPMWFYVAVATTVCSLILLFIGWIRQICRYIRTLGLLYAATDLRLLIIKRGKIIAEIPLDKIQSYDMNICDIFFGTGTVVFNQGSGYFKVYEIESPPNPSKVFAFYRVLDPDNVVLLLEV